MTKDNADDIVIEMKNCDSKQTLQTGDVGFERRWH